MTKDEVVQLKKLLLERLRPKPFADAAARLSPPQGWFGTGLTRLR
jgi:hypothetical protein